MRKSNHTSEAPATSSAAMAETSSPVAIDGLGETASTLRVPGTAVWAERADDGETCALPDLLAKTDEEEETAARRGGFATAKAGLVRSSICIGVLDSKGEGSLDIINY